MTQGMQVNDSAGAADVAPEPTQPTQPTQEGPPDGPPARPHYQNRAPLPTMGIPRLVSAVDGVTELVDATRLPAESADAHAIHDEILKIRKSVARIDKILLGGNRKLSRRQLAHNTGISIHMAQKFWRAMGFARVPNDAVAFTDADQEAITNLAALVFDGAITEETAVGLIRGIGHHMERLALWQAEALVEEKVQVKGLDEVEARREVLSELPDLMGVFEAEAIYAWRRQMASLSARMGAEVAHSLLQDQSESINNSQGMTLTRAIGFADLVSFTRLSQSIDGYQLASLVQTFENLARDIVTEGGGRVVKTVGDEILFVTDSAASGAHIAVSLSEIIKQRTDLPQVRCGLVWGPILSRLGDVFGPTVNLAARLEALAEPGTVVVDLETANAIEAAEPGRYAFEPAAEQNVRGVGTVYSTVITRAAGESIGL
ncbi:adenylate/guanylate cyclase domain-containing protein [Micrococcales bacterium 31B]|nr:adenylate/guanylate cyclase domain-containing protein [Micrococcales bacterium 31B]